ncbi:MAG: C_GCAxxG_C_C family protein [Coriobacteriia bacterium]|nr:C_GCAxxG_C_C family protein [Coriobacteriia bacterium]
MRRGEERRAADAARADHASARNCAESVLRAVTAEGGLPAVPESAGSGFTSGIGNTGCLCGALAGGVIVLGAYAETEGSAPEARRLRAEELSAEFLARFKERWGSTCCRVITRGFVPGTREAAARCAEVTENAAALAAAMVGDARAEAGSARRHGARDVTAAAERLAKGTLAGAGAGLAVSAAGALLAGGAPAGGLPPLLLALAGLALAAAAERGAPALRRAGRALHVAGLAGSALALAALTAPPARAALAAGLAGGGAWSAAGALAFAALAVPAALRAYELGRYR